ncbi:helix-turn-helix domain-containing protein [Lysinibacillus fusiformis]|uniref:helix-turn-helix domain-containing protein n=1 Tax=Lysinibacillus fusiformis TaxID=28031 RepID=UPI003D06857D
MKVANDENNFDVTNDDSLKDVEQSVNNKETLSKSEKPTTNQLEPHKLLAYRLKFLRQRNGWSMVDVQKKLGFTTLSSYANYEYGDRYPKISTLIKLAEIYDVSVDFLVGNDTDESLKEIQFYDSFSNDGIRRWVIDNFAEADEEDFEKLKEMWKIIKK